MKLRRLYRFVMLALAGGLVFQATASCSTDVTNAILSSVSSSLGTAIDAQIASFISQAFTCTSES